jgi:ATPase subunit of ABC transporter with duplicated ATPase domains
VTVVSGGEQRRSRLGKLAFHEPNVIEMDEPTNHLDV